MVPITAYSTISNCLPCPNKACSLRLLSMSINTFLYLRQLFFSSPPANSYAYIKIWINHHLYCEAFFDILAALLTLFTFYHYNISHIELLCVHMFDSPMKLNSCRAGSVFSTIMARMHMFSECL